VKEIANARIIAVTKYCFAFEMLFVVFEFVFDIYELGVKLIFFGNFGLSKAFSCHCDW
jgi:hypothetical protein